MSLFHHRGDEHVTLALMTRTKCETPLCYGEFKEKEPVPNLLQGLGWLTNNFPW